MDFFAKNIKFLRLQKGMKQAETASVLGFTQAAWSEYELGSSKPRFNDLIKIKEYFCITLSELVEIELSKGSPTVVLEFRNFVKKGSVKGSVTGSLKGENQSNLGMVAEPEGEYKSAVSEQLSRLENELKELRKKINR